MKKRPTPEEVFLGRLKKMIHNLLIDNPNYKTNYYANGSPHQPFDFWRLLEDTRERARYILSEIDKMEHMVLPFDIPEQKDTCWACGHNEFQYHSHAREKYCAACGKEQ